MRAISSSTNPGRAESRLAKWPVEPSLGTTLVRMTIVTATPLLLALLAAAYFGWRPIAGPVATIALAGFVAAVVSETMHRRRKRRPESASNAEADLLAWHPRRNRHEHQSQAFRQPERIALRERGLA